MGDYPIEILGNYGMSHGKVVDGEWKLVEELQAPVDTAFILEKCQYFREKYGYTKYYGDPVEFHSSGMVTFGLLGTKAPKEEKLAFDVDKKKRQAMFPEVCEVFKDYAVFIGGSTSFDLAPKAFNKYDAIVRYAGEHGISLDEVLFYGDDMTDGGNDSHVRLGGLDYVWVHDYRDFPELAEPMLK
jgi:hydroxymethylpyrimidine pyrophosphatase-like HAD family hydrolase